MSNATAGISRALIGLATLAVGVAVLPGIAQAGAPARPAVADGTLHVCQSEVGDLSTDSRYFITVRPKGSKKVVADGYIPNGTENYPGCRAISLPPGSYDVIERVRKGHPVVRAHLTGPNDLPVTIPPKQNVKVVQPKGGKALTTVRLAVAEYKWSAVVFYNKKKKG